MRKRMTAALLYAFALAMLLTGCIRTEVGVTLKADGSGTISTVVLIQADAYEAMKPSGDPFEGRETYTEIIDGTAYIGTERTEKYGSAEELKAALLSLTLIGNVPAVQSRVSDSESQPENTETPLAEGEELPNITQGAPIFKAADVKISGGILTFQAALNPQTDTGSESMANMSMNDIYTIQIAVTMPGEITSASAGTVTGRTVVWKINDITAENEITVISESEGGALLPTLAVGGVLVAAALSILWFIRKKRK